MLANFYKYNFGILAKDRILFFGSGRVAYPSAVKLHQYYPNLQIVTHHTPPKQKFKNQVEIFCKEKSLPYSTPIKSKGDKPKIKEEWNIFANEINDPDFGIVCSFGYMIPQIVISKFKKGMIVIHPSLLPKYRGGSPIFHAIANGQEKSGVSYIEISPGKFDSGNILLQKQHPLSKTAKYDQIEADLANFCAQNVLEVLENIDNLRPGKPQSELSLPEGQQYKLKAPIIKQKHLNLNQPAEQVYNVSRALGNPRINFQGQDLIVSFESKYAQDTENKEVGSLRVKNKKLYVKCQDKFIKVESWREPSKKQTPCGIFIAAYLRGKQEKDWPRFQ